MFALGSRCCLHGMRIRAALEAPDAGFARAGGRRTHGADGHAIASRASKSSSLALCALYFDTFDGPGPSDSSCTDSSSTYRFVRSVRGVAKGKLSVPVRSPRFRFMAKVWWLSAREICPWDRHSILCARSQVSCLIRELKHEAPLTSTSMNIRLCNSSFEHDSIRSSTISTYESNRPALVY